MSSIEIYKKIEQKQLSENFKLSEFHCHCDRASCEETLMDSELIRRLQWMRDKSGRSITVNSGYRCPSHNSSKAVGGSKTSKHMQGRAADIVIKGMTPKQMARLAVEAGFRGIIMYSNRIHVDTRLVSVPYYRNKTTYGYSTVKPQRWSASVKCNPWVEPEETVKYGDKGYTVRWVQWAIAKSGIVCSVDGDFGGRTLAAVKRYQTAHKLEADGRVGPATRAILKKEVAI